MIAAVGRAHQRGGITRRESRGAWLVLAALTLWVVASAAFAASDGYLDPRALRFLPLLCGFLVPCLFVALCAWQSSVFRGALRGVVSSLPIPWLVGVHAIRISAFGTILKLVEGELPAHFVLPVAVPDFLVGLTAIPLSMIATRSAPWARRILVAWNVVGCAIFALAGILLHVSMPGPVRIFTSGPTTAPIFELPLALVPTFLVPFFVGVHLACLWRLRQPGATTALREDS